jgi:hypothetical protein
MVKAEIRSCHLNWSIVITDQDLRTNVCLLLAVQVAGKNNCFVSDPFLMVLGDQAGQHIEAVMEEYRTLARFN